MRGFTLIEILIVLAISTVLSALAISYSHIAQNQVALSVEAAKVGETILRAKNLAVASYGAISGTCGFGVTFNTDSPQSYSLFAYTPPGAPPCPDPALVSNVGAAEMSQISFSSWLVPIARGVVMTSTADSLKTIIFFPPAPKTILSHDGSAFINSTLRVHLVTVDGSLSSTVVVDPGGQVTF